MLFDTLTAARQLTEAGMNETQAAAVVGVLRSAVTEGVAAKADIAELRAEVKADIAELRDATKAAIAEFQATTRADIAELRAEMYRVLSEQGQRQERLKNAIEHLGNEKGLVRLGGAYELFHLAQDTQELRQTVLDILCAHIRQTTSGDEYREKHKAKPSEEVQSMLTLFFVQKHEVFKNCPINLQESWLNGISLAGARLAKADLSQARLQRADLRSAQLQGAQLAHAQLQGAQLRRAQLQGAQLAHAQLQEAQLVGAQLQEARLAGAQLQEARLAGAQLQGAGLRHARLQGADLAGAQLQEARLAYAQLQGAKLAGAQLQRAELWSAQLQGAKLGGAQLQGAELEDAQLQGAKLGGAQLQRAKLMDAQLQGAWLVGAQLQGANLMEAQLQGANLMEARLRGTDLRSAQLQGVGFHAMFGVPFEERIRDGIGKPSDLSKVVFAGGLSQEAIDSRVKGLSDEHARQLREELTPHLDKPLSHEPPDGAVTGAYTAEEAERWIAEYQQAMSEVPKAEAD